MSRLTTLRLVVAATLVTAFTGVAIVASPKSAATMQKAATLFVDSLSPDQKAKASFPFVQGDDRRCCEQKGDEEGEATRERRLALVPAVTHRKRPAPAQAQRERAACEARNRADRERKTPRHCVSFTAPELDCEQWMIGLIRARCLSSRRASPTVPRSVSARPASAFRLEQCDLEARVLLEGFRELA